MTDYSFRAINPAAMIAWAAAIGVSFLSPSQGVFCVAPLNAILTAAVVYAAADRLISGPARLPAQESGR